MTFAFEFNNVINVIMGLKEKYRSTKSSIYVWLLLDGHYYYFKNVSKKWKKNSNNSFWQLQSQKPAVLQKSDSCFTKIGIFFWIAVSQNNLRRTKLFCFMFCILEWVWPFEAKETISSQILLVPFVNTLSCILLSFTRKNLFQNIALANLNKYVSVLTLSSL